MQSVMNHNFSQIPKVEMPRSTFNRSHGYKTTFDATYLVPFYVDEALPGDTFRLKANIFARLATPIFPIMDNLFLETFYFAVPNRLVWMNWNRFCGEQTDPGDSTDYLVPTVNCPEGGYLAKTVFDYMGIPTLVDGLEVNALPFRAYNLIYNEWFKDQNLQNQVTVHKSDQQDGYDDYDLMKRGKRHDYFTSCLPWPQKGPGVPLPLGSTAPVWGDGYGLNMTNNYDNFGYTAYSGDVFSRAALAAADKPVGTTITPLPVSDSYVRVAGVVRPTDGALHSGLYADLSDATASTINSLREAFQLQRMYERDARGGTRYTEIIRSHFGVISPDARLQRPEYLGGSSTRININPVQQTAPTKINNVSGSPMGTLAAYGLAADSSGGFTKSFTEHCTIIGLVNVRADITYQQGIPRMFKRQTRFDYYWPSLAHLGEQEVLNQEIFAQGNSADTEVFGYQERYAEYRYFPSQITGLFRSNATGSLDAWHLAEDFGALPQLNAEFIVDATNETLDRAIAVPSEPQIIFDSYIELNCARPMPVYSVPGLIDHF